jgi:hypothetical protein
MLFLHFFCGGDNVFFTESALVADVLGIVINIDINIDLPGRHLALKIIFFSFTV